MEEIMEVIAQNQIMVNPGEKSSVIAKKSNFILLDIIQGSGKIKDLDYNEERCISSGASDNGNILLKGERFVLVSSKNPEPLVVNIFHVFINFYCKHKL